MDESLTAHLLHSYEFLNEAAKGEPDSNNEKVLVFFFLIISARACSAWYGAAMLVQVPPVI